MQCNCGRRESSRTGRPGWCSGSSVWKFGPAFVERPRAEAALRESEARLSSDLAGIHRLYALHARLATETNHRAALEQIVAAASEFMHTDRGCVQLVSEDGKRLEMYAHRGYTGGPRFIEHFLHEGSKPACDAARRQRRRLIIEDVETFPPLRDTADREVALSDRIRATKSTPMIAHSGEPLGVLSAQFRHPHRPSDEELRRIDLLAWTAADLIERHLAHKKHARPRRPDVKPHGMLAAGGHPHAGRSQKAMTAHCRAAAAITRVWKSSW